MQPVEPILVTDLFPPLNAALVELLRRLSPEDWARPTAAAGWTVKDMAAHLLDTDIRRLSAQRDRQSYVPPEQPIETYADLVAHLNRLNAEWVRVAKRFSPRVLTDFLALVGPQMEELYRGLDPFAPAPIGVSWAGEEESLNWFDVAREYTEKWMHQQQIRDAVGAPGLTSRAWLHPVLDTFLRGMPHIYRGVDAAEGARVGITITGEAGDDWVLVRQADGWQLFSGWAVPVEARARIEQDTAWRLFTKGLSAEEARQRSHVEGDPRLAEAVFHLIAIMA